MEAARAAGVSVEAELGTIENIGESGERINNPYMTYPAAAKDFASRTGIDCLAISFGTVHGLYRHEPEFDLARLEAISRVVYLPLVMYGGSGVPDNSLEQSIKRGISS